MIEPSFKSQNPYDVTSNEPLVEHRYSKGIVYDTITLFIGATSCIVIEFVLVWISRGQYSSLDRTVLRLTLYSAGFFTSAVAILLLLKRANILSLLSFTILTFLVILISIINLALVTYLSGPLV